MAAVGGMLGFLGLISKVTHSHGLADAGCYLGAQLKCLHMALAFIARQLCSEIVSQE